MISRMLNRRRAERFAQLLDEADGSRRHRARTPVDAELAELVALSRRVRAVSEPSDGPSPEFRTSLRTILIAQAQHDGLGATAVTTMPERAVPEVPVSTQLRPALATVRSRPRRIVVGLVAAGALTVTGISAASDAVPGDPLYSVKRSTERAQFALAGSDLNRAQLRLDFARIRLTEAQQVQDDPVSFIRTLDEMDAELRDGFRLFSAAAVAHRDTSVLDTVLPILTGQRQQVAVLLVGSTREARTRAAQSIVLLDSIRRRAEAVRSAILCNAGHTGESDALGPLPRSCPTVQGPVGSGLPTGNHPRVGDSDAPRADVGDPTPRPHGTSGDGEIRVDPGELTKPKNGHTPDRDAPPSVVRPVG